MVAASNLPAPLTDGELIQSASLSDVPDAESLAAWLLDKGLDTADWGKDNTKGVSKFWKEIKLNEAALELWRAADGSLIPVRTTHVLRAKVTSPDRYERGIFLFNTWQQYGDGRTRTRNGLLSEKLTTDEMPLEENLHEAKTCPESVLQSDPPCSIYSLVGGLRLGRTLVEVAPESSVCELQRLAQGQLGSRGKLWTSAGESLSAGTVRQAQLCDGDVLTLQTRPLQLVEGSYCWACIMYDGSVVTWGDTSHGGDSWAVRERLRNVKQVAAAGAALAAVTEDGSVEVWGPLGLENMPAPKLSGVRELIASAFSFAALMDDGSVVTWGLTQTGGDSSSVQAQLKDVQQIVSTGFAFAALTGDGSVLSWGTVDSSSDIKDQLRGVRQVAANSYAFAALCGDGSVVTWGWRNAGGDSSRVDAKLQAVKEISPSEAAFAALLEDGSVVSWGDQSCRARKGVQRLLKNVQQVAGTSAANAFAALRDDGSVVTWGCSQAGGDSSHVRKRLKNVRQVHASGSAFAALLNDGSVVTWGDSRAGGDSTAVQEQLREVRQIHAVRSGFLAVLPGQSLVAWGTPDFASYDEDLPWFAMHRGPMVSASLLKGVMRRCRRIQVCRRAVTEEEMQRVVESTMKIGLGRPAPEYDPNYTCPLEVVNEHFVDHIIELEKSKSYPGLLTMYHLYTVDIVCTGLPLTDLNTLEFEHPDKDGKRKLKYIHAWVWLEWPQIQRYLFEGSELKETKRKGRRLSWLLLSDSGSTWRWLFGFQKFELFRVLVTVLKAVAKFQGPKQAVPN
ncbi:HERC2 [Symbiodinium sp. KB8]|nr:HERC2 [Symbiodinium sp. KB8]